MKTITLFLLAVKNSLPERIACYNNFNNYNLILKEFQKQKQNE